MLLAIWVTALQVFPIHIPEAHRHTPIPGQMGKLQAATRASAGTYSVTVYEFGFDLGLTLEVYSCHHHRVWRPRVGTRGLRLSLGWGVCGRPSSACGAGGGSRDSWSIPKSPGEEDPNVSSYEQIMTLLRHYTLASIQGWLRRDYGPCQRADGLWKWKARTVRIGGMYCGGNHRFIIAHAGFALGLQTGWQSSQRERGEVRRDYGVSIARNWPSGALMESKGPARWRSAPVGHPYQ